MDPGIVAGQILILLLMAGLGLLLRRRGLLPEAAVGGINNLVLKVAFPALVLVSSQRRGSEALRGEFFRVLAAGALLMSAAGLLVYFVAGRRFRQRRRGVFALLSILPNAAFMGMPLVQALFGEDGAFLLSAFAAAFNLTQWTVGVLLMAGPGFRPGKLLLNPGLLASLAAAALLALDVRLPPLVLSLGGQLAGLTTPLAMLLAGVRLNDFRWRDLNSPALFAALGLKLAVFPLLSFLLLRAAGFSGLSLNVMVLAAAMPSAVSVLLFSENYGGDSLFAAAGVSVSTLLCLGTVPLVLAVCGLG